MKQRLDDGERLAGLRRLIPLLSPQEVERPPGRASSSGKV
jgi:hypothetical protein